MEEISISPSAYLKALKDLGRLWTSRRPHPLGMIPAAHYAAWHTGLINIGA